jgi:hypothetical protein
MSDSTIVPFTISHEHYVPNIFGFRMDGTIWICGFNGPGTMHNSTFANYGNVYKKLEQVFEEAGGKAVVD